MGRARKRGKKRGYQPGKTKGILYRVVVAPGTRTFNRATQRYEDNETRCEALLEQALADGVITQHDGSRGFFWWEGPPGDAMRALRDAIGGEPVRDEDGPKAIEMAARRVGNATIAGDS